MDSSSSNHVLAHLFSADMDLSSSNPVLVHWSYVFSKVIVFQNSTSTGKYHETVFF